MAAATDRPALRRDAERRGRRAEAVALWLLRLKGYRLVARRYKTSVGEIDLIVRRGRTIAFVEVKSRPTMAEATEAATPAGRRRIARAASLWLARNPKAAEATLRFDVVLLAPGHWPRHLSGVFDADGAA
ncbi:MAG: YraN family protein [Bauldia sp.]